VILDATRIWACPNCHLEERQSVAVPNRWHNCPVTGLFAPLVVAGSGTRVVYHEREDYVNGEAVQTDNTGRPVSHITTERPDGSTDVIVFPPTATGSNT
jgi:hypothetical protein